MRTSALVAALSTVGLVGCGDDGGSSQDTDDDDDSASGFTSGAVTSAGTETDSATDSAGTDSSGSDSDSNGPGYDTLGEGDMRGLLTFTLYPADAVTGEDIVGMAGAWRDVSNDIEGVDDFFGLYGLDTMFPPPPADIDTIEHNGLLVAFDWGAPGDWLLAGNAMKLRLPDTAAQACLLYRGGESTIEIPPGSGMEVPNYPIYAATNSELQPEGCAPDPATWQEDTEYDIVLYGGDLFDDNSLVGQVHTPPGFELTAPDFTAFQDPVDSQSPLTISWSANGNTDNRVVIRVWDMFGRMFTALATDDGEFTIPAADLQMLDVGPMTVTVARENIEDVPFTDGLVRVVTRYEHWGYFDLF